MHSLLDLFVTFVRIGFMMFGGGYAMLPILQKEVVEKKAWVSETELSDYYAISQCTPGAIAVNVATFTGYKIRGAAGGVAATFGVIFPSLIIICVLAGLISNFSDLPVVQHAFASVRVCVCVLIFNGISKLWKGSVTGFWTFVIFLSVLFGRLVLNFSPILFIFGSAVIGIFLTILPVKKKFGGIEK